MHFSKLTLSLAAVSAVLAGCATTPVTPTSTTAATKPSSTAATAAPALAAATTKAAEPPAPAAAPTSAAARPAAPPAAGTPPPFAEVTKDAKSSAGFLNLWTREAKVWLEIPADRLDKPFFLGNSLASGLGERFLLPGLMGAERVVMLKRVDNTVQLIALNLHARAPEGTPLARAIAESYSDSLLAVAPLAASPHPERKSLLVDAMALLGGDILGLQTALESSYRLAYGLDRANSRIERSTTSDQATSLTVRGHYSIPKLPASPAMAPGAPPPNPAAMPNPSRVVPDPRSLFLSVAYTLAPLPTTPMKARRADQRVGYFTDAFVDFGNDTSGDRKVNLVQRWRLEKKNPAATVSEPKEPIRVVMDRNIPLRWRSAVREGILIWNTAFEEAGFKNALVVEQQADNADWSTFDGVRLLAVRWFAMEGPGATAVGPSQSDPRTGEILRGAAIIPENWVRFERATLTDNQPPLPPLPPASSIRPGEFAARFAQCSYADDLMEQTAFGLQLLAMRGDIESTGPQADRFIEQSLRAVVAHEVGHAIGLRHNFKASTGINRSQLRDASFTAKRGISNSVMDYNPLNLPLKGEPIADYHMPGLGSYDMWAIEYGYREFAPNDETAGLARIAAQSDSNPALAYATDEDTSNNDPLINRFDLGDNPMAFAQRQIQLGRELWQNIQTRPLAANDDFITNRQVLQRGFARFAQSAPILARYIGGSTTSRSLAGANKPLVLPVPSEQQRQALNLLLNEVFASSSFKFSPEFMQRLGIDHFDRWNPSSPSIDFSLPATVAGLQRTTLDGLMAEGLAMRLANAESKTREPRNLLSYAEVQQRLRQAIWSELSASAVNGNRNIDSLRRNLQREHIKRLGTGLVRATPSAAADVRSAHRQEALALENALRGALSWGGWSPAARAHLVDSQAALAQALRAQMVKQGD